MIKERRAPTPDELRHQFFGAAIALSFVLRARALHGLWWREEGLDTCRMLRDALLRMRDNNVHGERLSNLLLSVLPADKQPQSEEAKA